MVHATLRVSPTTVSARTRGDRADSQSQHCAEMPAPSQNSTVHNSESIESKFAHLLQPIRALADNWDIDLAKELEEYVGDLERISFTFEDGATKLNFAEAALLIQGSANVWTKKVEFLYTMVHQTLDAVADKRKKQKRSSQEQVGDADYSIEAQDEFLPYDDIEESANIDLQDDGVENHRNGSIPLLPRIPPSLVPATADANQINDTNVELLSSAGEVIGRRDDFKINTAIVHASGALLLDSSEHFLEAPCSYVAAAVNMVHEFENSYAAENVGEDMEDAVDVPEADHSQSGADMADPEDDNALPIDELCDVPDEDVLPPGGANNSHGAAIDAPRRIVLPADRPAQETKPPPLDPWELLDPHDPGSIPEKPYKKGRPYRIPKLKTNNAQDDAPLPVKDYLRHMQFAYVFFAELKRRKDNTRQAARLAAAQTADDEGNLDDEDFSARRGDYPLTSAWDIPVDHGAADDGDNVTEEPYRFGPPAGFESDDDEPDQHIVENLALDNDPFETAQPAGEPAETYEDLCRMRIESYLLTAEKFEHEVESTLAKRVKSWESRLKPILEEEERRPFLDVGVYGTRVVERFLEREVVEDGIMDFSSIVHNVDRHDVPRLFLATLHLANARNVDIDSNGAVGHMRVKLLDRNVRSLDT